MPSMTKSKLFFGIILPTVLVLGSIPLHDSFAESQDQRESEVRVIEEIFQGIVDGELVVEKRKVDAIFSAAPLPEVVGCEKVDGYVPAKLNPEVNSKIIPDLQKQIDSGKDILCIDIVLPYHTTWPDYGLDSIPGWNDVKIHHAKDALEHAKKSAKETIDDLHERIKESKEKIDELEHILNATSHQIMELENMPNSDESYLDYGYDVIKDTKSDLETEKMILDIYNAGLSKLESQSDLQVFDNGINAGIGAGMHYFNEQKRIHAGNYATENLNNIKEFLHHNNATLEINRFKVEPSNPLNMHFGAAVSSKLIPELVLRDDVILLDVYGKQLTPGYIEPIDKIIGKQVLDSGMYVDQCAEKYFHEINFYEDIPVYVETSNPKPVLELLHNNNIKTTNQNESTIHTHIPVHMIIELAETEEVTSIGYYHSSCIRSMGMILSDEYHKILNGFYDVPLVSNPEDVSFDITHNGTVATLDISGDVSNVYFLEMPKNISETKFDIILNDVAVVGDTVQHLEIFVNDYPLTNYAISPRGSQTVLAIQDYLYEKNNSETNPVIESILPQYLMDDKTPSEDIVIHSIPNLKQQLANGVAVENITCKSEHVLVIRNNGEPSCMTERNAVKLADRLGWKITKS